VNYKPRILIKRRQALGDVIMTTPIVRRLRQELGRDAIINVATDNPSAFLNNPHIDAVISGGDPTDGYDRMIDLDLAYERRPEMRFRRLLRSGVRKQELRQDDLSLAV